MQDSNSFFKQVYFVKDLSDLQLNLNLRKAKSWTPTLLYYANPLIPDAHYETNWPLYKTNC